MIKRNLIICPSCSKRGLIQVLGEISPDGDLLVMRFKKGLTIIKGGEFEVECGVCQEPVYIKKERRVNEVVNFRPAWFHRFTLINQTISSILPVTGITPIRKIFP